LETVFIIGKLKHLEGTLRYLLEAGSFRLCGAIAAVLELISLYVAGLFWIGLQLPCHVQLFLCEVLPFRVIFSLGKRKKSQGIEYDE
jgi:hypothetical protein